MFIHNCDVMTQIFRHLDAKTYFRARQVCKQWRSVANDPLNLWWQISEILLDASCTEESTENLDNHNLLRNLTRSYGGKKADPCQLMEIYLDLVRFKMVLYEISITDILYLWPHTQDNFRLLSSDGKYFLITDNSKDDGYMRIVLVNVFTGKSQVFHHQSRRTLELICLSPDNKYVAISSSYGYLEVLKLKDQRCEVIYERQYPSHFESIAVSRGGEVFMGKSIRLGGYSVVNLDTEEEIDINHYRLDLSLQLLFDDLVIVLPGIGETFIYGWPCKYSPGRRGQLWKYLEYLIRNDIFYYVARPRAIPLPLHKGYFLTLDEDADPIYRLELIYEEYREPIGFKAITEFSNKRKVSKMDEWEKEKEERNRNEEEEDEEDEEEKANQEEKEKLKQKEDEKKRKSKGKEKVLQSVNDNLENKKETNDIKGDEEEESEEEKQGIVDYDGYETDVVHLQSILTRFTWCLSSDASRMAVLGPKKIYIYALRNSLYEAYTRWSVIPYRSIGIDESFTRDVTRMSFVDEERLVVWSPEGIMHLSISLDKAEKPSDEDPVKS